MLLRSIDHRRAMLDEVGHEKRIMDLDTTSAQVTPGILRLGSSSRKTMNHCCLLLFDQSNFGRSALHAFSGKCTFSHNPTGSSVLSTDSAGGGAAFQDIDV